MRFFLALQSKILAGLEVADGEIAVVDCFDDRNDHATDAKQRSGFERSIACQIDAVEPIDIGPRIAFGGKEIVFFLLFHLAQRFLHGLGSLVGEPKALEGFALPCVGGAHANADNDLPFSIGVPRVDDGIDVGTVAEPFDNFKLPNDAAVNLFVFVAP